MVEDNPDDFIHDVFHQSFWKDHPLGMSILGDQESIAGLTRDKIIGFKNKMYRGDDIIITAAGNVDNQELLALLKQHLPEIQLGNGRENSPVPVLKKSIETVERDLEQVHMCLGFVDCRKTTPNASKRSS